MSALIVNGYNPAPHHRQNRRRERPGSRSRRSITRKSQVHDTCLEGLYDARDTSLYLPSVKPAPSPLQRQSFDKSWERWKAREAEEKALAELDKTQLELEQRRLFGGDVGDDELHSMGILYDDEDAASASVDKIQQTPAFVIRPNKPRNTRRSSWEKLSFDISFFDIRNHAAIAPTTTPSLARQSLIQHPAISNSNSNWIHDDAPTIPQSLPLSSPSALEPIPESCEPFDIPLPSPPSIGDWTFVHAAQHTPVTFAPPSDPETWILLDDDS